MGCKVHNPTMTVSYASATAASATTATATATLSKPSFASQVEELSKPPPTSLTLVASLQLLAPLDTRTDVYLMTRSYMQNWLIWAYHQKVPKVEASRVEAAVRLAADRLGLTPPCRDMPHSDPGPIDSSILSMEGHPLLLRPNVVAVGHESTEGQQIGMHQSNPDDLRRVKSLPETNHSDLKSEEGRDDAEEEGVSPIEDVEKDGNFHCCAVPERFYEVRSVYF